jgi:enamine deaminase RidA (YjgF/YER057c/UK114 family)
MNRLAGILAAAALTLAFTAQAQEAVPVKRIADKGLFAGAVWAGGTLYVSGMMADAQVPGDPAKGIMPTYTADTKAQTISALTKIEGVLKEQGLTMGDVVQAHVFLAGDPAKGGKMDFAGMNDGFKQFFGTPEQPNKPTRATVQVASLVAPTGLVEIEVVAVKSK